MFFFFFFQAEDGIRDLTVTGVQTLLFRSFVHLHPEGTISVAAQETFVLREPGDTVRGRLAQRLAAMPMGSGEQRAVRPGAVSFPYAFPQPGHYRMWVQVKRNSRILTGVFDAEVSPAR